jgi:hypothetical protein
MAGMKQDHVFGVIPDPGTARTLDESIEALRVWAGQPSYAEFAVLKLHLNDRRWRLLLGLRLRRGRAVGSDGITLVVRVSGVSRTRVQSGSTRSGQRGGSWSGAGRAAVEDVSPGVVVALELSAVPPAGIHRCVAETAMNRGPGGLRASADRVLVNLD